MPKITFINADGSKVVSDAQEGHSLMEAAVKAGIDGIIAQCGGGCVCGTCHCYIDPQWVESLGSASDDESDLLDFVIDPQENSRLSCQIQVTSDMDGLVVHVPEMQT